MDGADNLFTVEAKLTNVVRTAPEGVTRKALEKRLAQVSRNAGFKRKREVNEARSRLRDACAIVILITVGMRISELVSIKAGGYRHESREDITLYFIEAHVAKTGDGLSEFVAPEIAIRAFRVLEQLSVDLRARHMELLDATRISGDSHKYAELIAHEQGLFLAKSNKNGTISTHTGMNVRLKAFVAGLGIDWDFNSHQARRTFAVNVARSSRGDLMLLKEHFKHWSLDMTVLYAAHESADEELWDCVYDAVSNLRVETIGRWLGGNALLAGGLAHRMMTLRANDEDVKVYGSREKLIEVVSETVNIRSTGVAWCTAADINCGGGYGMERTRCADCSSSVIEASPHQAKWEAMLIQQLELKELSDIGVAAKERAERDYQHCRQVLTDLGCDVDALEAEPI
nr:tyrosine-type recombinase/integrase [Microbulbifer salipaludis]